MKNTLMIALVAFIFIATTANAQDKKERKSPLKEVTTTVGNADVGVKYSSPSVKDREVWGELVAYDKVWRTGANEATTFEASADIMVNGKKLPAGKYSVFTIPTKGDWTLIFNSEWEQWGAYKYDESKDVLRLTVKPKKIEHEEMLVIGLTESKMTIAWEKLAIEAKLSN